MKQRTAIVILLVLALLGCKKIAGELRKRAEESQGVTPSSEPVTPAAPTASAPVAEPGTPAAGWKVFASPEGRFSVDMPGTPTPSKQQTPTAAGTLDMHMFTVTHKNGSAWIVNYSDYPAALIRLGNKDKILDGAMNGAIESAGGSAVQKKTIEVSGNPGREFSATAATQGLEYTGLVVLSGSRLYQLIVVSLPGTVKPAEIRAFFDSLKITKA